MPKDERLHMRIDTTKKRVWEAAAAREGRTLAEWLTRAGDTAQAARPYLTPDDIETFDSLREQLRRAGVNLNTLVRSTLAYDQGRARDLPDAQDFQQVRVELQEVLSKILATLNTKV